MYLRPKILHSIILIFLIAIIIILGIYDFPYIKQVYQARVVSNEKAPNGQLSQSSDNNFDDYFTKTRGVLVFHKFLPQLVLNNSKVIWYSLAPRTESFKSCRFNETPKINFYVEQTSPVFTPVLGIDIIDGLQCDSGKCYYKTIRLIAGQSECQRSNFPDAASFASCTMANEALYNQGYYYPINSKIVLRYTISCCAKGLCQQASNFKLKKIF